MESREMQMIMKEAAAVDRIIAERAEIDERLLNALTQGCDLTAPLAARFQIDAAQIAAIDELIEAQRRAVDAAQ